MKQHTPNIAQLHQEQLSYIGQLLREMREEMSLSHEELSRKTLIRPSLLKAIEAGSVSQLPEPVYTRGLIRRYGESLGLDGEALASQYFTPPNQTKGRSFWRTPLTPQLRPLHLYATYVALIAIAISGLSYTLQRTTNRASSLPVLEGEVAEQAKLPESGGQVERPNAATANTGEATVVPVSSDPIRVSVEMQDQSWLRITADSEVVFEGILKEGDTQNWTAQEKLTIRAGNAGGVLVAFNEGRAEALGQPGSVKETSFPPEDTASLGNL